MGSCRQRARSVESWSEKSKEGTNRTKNSPQAVQMCFDCENGNLSAVNIYSHLAFAVSSYLLCTGGVAFLQHDAGTHLLPQPLIFHSNHLGNKPFSENMFPYDTRYGFNQYPCSLEILCFPLVVLSLTCASCTLWWVRRNCSISAG